MNMKRYVLIACSVITMVFGFPSNYLPGFSYSADEIILCGSDLPVIAENLCKGQFLGYNQNVSHEENALLLMSVCCVEICTEKEILTKYCMATRTTTPIPTKPEHSTDNMVLYGGHFGFPYFRT